MKLDHVAVAVGSIDAALPFFRDALGLAVAHREELVPQGVRVAFLGDPAGVGSETQLELLEPVDPQGPVAKFLERRGPGVHHIAFRAPDLESACAKLRAAGRPPIETQPRPGARGHQVCFLHPRHAEGVLVELVG